MLIRFEVANFRSILDPVELSMVAVDRDRPEARSVPNLGESLLPVAAVFGANASGKSNVVAAMTWLHAAVQDSLAFWDDEIPVQPFAFAGGPDRSTDFTIEIVIAGVRFEYVVELDRHAVRYEGLFHYPERKRRRIFERDGDDLTLQRGLGGLSGSRELLTPRALMLTVARRFEEPLVSDFARSLLAIQTWGLTTRGTRRSAPDPRSTRRLFEVSTDENAETRTRAIALLRLADLGIDDVLVEDRRVTSGVDEYGVEQRMVWRNHRLVHRTAHGPVPLDFAAESEGTRTWFGLIGPVLSALSSGTLLLFDELDASLHPTLSAELIRLFHDPATNPAGAQLVFTSHDTSLLDHLNRDEVWLTEKSADGTTRLGALAEFAEKRVRRSRNLEKAYLSGRFGAVPDVDRTGMLRALGLIG